MPSSSSASAARTFSPAVYIAGGLALVVLIAALIYLNRPVPPPRDEPASAAAKAYVKNLELRDVAMQASENLMQQQVVEIQGKLTNRGNRALDSVDVYCLFYGVDGREIHRERVPMLHSAGKPLAPNEARGFRLPFDSLPPEWNQAMPHLVIAGINFAR